MSGVAGTFIWIAIKKRNGHDITEMKRRGYYEPGMKLKDKKKKK
jgi:hypothetical protein